MYFIPLLLKNIVHFVIRNSGRRDVLRLAP